MPRRKTTEQFIRDAIKVHGNKYGYSKVDYINANTKVIIICPHHGDFEQTPNNHTIFKQGCPECAIQAQRLTTEDFIEKARKIHGYKYGYSKVDYINANTKVIIICPHHGDFEQTLNNHLKGRGCKKCYGDSKRLTTEDFIKKARKVHGYKYGYNLVNYVDTNTKITIICPHHGAFEQTPNSHLMNHGCPECAIQNKKLTIKDFIDRARKVHGYKYGYNLVNYVDANTKIIIICPEHGEFLQRPNNHLSGCGCPNCCNNGPSKAERQVVDYIQTLYDDEIILNSRSIISPLELDIYLPDINLAIEYNGTYWHSRKFKPEGYHRNKTKRCADLGIRLFHIPERAWTTERGKELWELRIKNYIEKKLCK